MLEANAHVEQQGGGQRLVIVQTGCGSIDLLHANGRQRERQAVGIGELAGRLLGEVEREMRAIRKNLINFDCRDLLAAVVGVVLRQVLRDQAVGGIGNEGLNLQRNRVHQALGNDVTGVWIRDDTRICTA